MLKQKLTTLAILYFLTVSLFNIADGFDDSSYHLVEAFSREHERQQTSWVRVSVMPSSMRRRGLSRQEQYNNYVRAQMELVEKTYGNAHRAFKAKITQPIINLRNNINSTDPVKSAKARLDFLSLKLPPPFDVYLRHAQYKFHEQYTDKHGRLLGSLKQIDPAQFLFGIAKNITMLGLKTLKFGGDHYFDPKTARESRKHLWDLAKTFKLQCQYASTPKITREATRLTTETLVMAKTCNLLSKFFQKAALAIEASPGVTAVEALSTPCLESSARIISGEGSIVYFKEFKNVAPAGNIPEYATSWLADATAEMNKRIALREYFASRTGLIPRLADGMSSAFMRSKKVMASYASSMKSYLTKSKTNPIIAGKNIAPLSSKLKKAMQAKKLTQQYELLLNSLPDHNAAINSSLKSGQKNIIIETPFLGKPDKFHMNPDHTFKLNVKFKKTLEIDGFHYVYQNKIHEYSEFITFENVIQKGEWYGADVSIFGGKSKFKTFFPGWEEEIVKEKMIEALQDVKKITPVRNSLIRHKAIGYTQENARLVFIIDIIDNKKTIVTSYPCKHWLKGRLKEKTYELLNQR